MVPFFRRALRSSLALTLLAYGLGIALASTVTALGAYRVATTVLSIVKEGAASRTPTSERETDATNASTFKGERDAPRMAQMFGSSSRYWRRRDDRYRDEDEEDEDRWDRDDDDDEEWGEYRQSRGTYRTLCVRLCDGYYFPISFATTRGQFNLDARACETSCPGQARLFVYPNPGGDVEHMVDLSGQPYRDLKTAFLYRTKYVPSCRCKPEPWSPEAKAQHRIYALQGAVRKGDQRAKAELAELLAKVQREQPVPVRPASGPGHAPTVAEDGSRSSAGLGDDTTGRMGLGAKAQPQRPSARPRREPDWMARAFERP